MAMADGTKDWGRAKGTENRTTREIRDHFASFYIMHLLRL